MPGEPRAAAAIVLVRPGDGGVPELLFVRRPQSMRFLGGFHAFVGGALDPGDSSAESIAASALSPEEASSIMGDAASDNPAVSYFICAVRELFEEVGILLKLGEGEPDRKLVAQARRDLLADQVSMGAAAASLGTKLATDALHYHSRWIAPEALPIRFDVRVFVTRAVGEPDPDAAEVDIVQWLPASAALALAESGEILMAPPTAATVSSMVPYETVDELLRGGKKRASPKIERHSALVRRVVAPNASIMTGPGTNTWIVGRNEVVVIDPGSMEADHVQVVARSGDIRTIVLTHHHPDHISGALELAELTGAELAASPLFFERSAMAGRGLIEGDLVEVPGATMEVVETPGHASGHISLFLREERALFSGDLVLGEGTPVISPPDGDLVEYLESLEKVIALKPERIYPGHFDPRDDALEWMSWYRAHRIERESQILNALREALTISQIVEAVYAGYPKAIHPIAERTVLAHLMKLEAEGRVTREGELFSIPH